ncbi:shikimate kinase [Candidatus Sumerlaeota bacterium]|nr:shikimate kinase [Candidatus Sumerlaeota bacterium]
MEDNIILVGFMGTGKTVVGKELAQALDFKYIDTDLMIEAEAKMTIPEIFKNLGEDAFRKMETEALKRVSHLKKYVVATGGGIVMKNENIDLMKKTGMVICLTATPEIIYNRTRENSDRPLLQTPDPMKKIISLLKFRESQYQIAADFTIDTSNLAVKTIVETIISLWAKEEP